MSGKLVGIVVGGMCLVGGSWGQNVVVNGDFEIPRINFLYEHIPPGSSRIDGWQVDAPSAGQGVDIINANFQPGIAKHGLQAIDLAGSPGRGSIYQTFTSVIGTTYIVSFWVSSNGGPFTAGATLAVNGVSVLSIDSPPSGTWQRIETSFVASSGATEIRFIGNRDGNAGVFLDSVAIVRNVPSVSGHIDLANVDDVGHTVDVAITPVGGGTPLQQSQVTLDEGGYFYLPTSLSGPVDVTFKASHWLRRRVAGVSLSPYDADLEVVLTNGDCDDDNEIGIGDYAIISSSYNSCFPDPGFDSRSDLNGDTCCDIADYAILSANYGLTGD